MALLKYVDDGLCSIAMSHGVFIANSLIMGWLRRAADGDWLSIFPALTAGFPSAYCHGIYI
jgi:hypothetical protein